LDGESEEIRRNRFFEIWTKKEAYLKWKGCGLAGGLKKYQCTGEKVCIPTDRDWWK